MTTVVPNVGSEFLHPLPALGGILALGTNGHDPYHSHGPEALAIGRNEIRLARNVTVS